MNADAFLFPLAKRFVAGITHDEALAVLKALNEQGMSGTLDFLGEDVTSASAADTTVKNYLELIAAMKKQPLKTNLSVKLSALGLAFDPAAAHDRLGEILHAAGSLPDPFVRVDMERAHTVSQTLTIVKSFHHEGHPIGPVLQAYLRRTAADVEQMIDQRIRVRLCKGAYSEAPDLAHTDRLTIRREFLRHAESLLSRGNYPGIATHDPKIIEAVQRLSKERGISSDQFEFQMLYGVCPTLQKQLAAAGYNVRIYIPYGSHWSGYFRRRILERKENVVFALGALFTK